MKLKIDKINWKLTGRKEPQECAVLPWEDRLSIEQQGFEAGWEAHRKYAERQAVDAARKKSARGG